MFKANYKMAGKVIEINSMFEQVQNYCKDYLTDEKADFSVTTDMDDIKYERKKSESEDICEGRPIREFSDDYLEELAVYRQISDNMLKYDTLLFHGSVIAVDGEGFLFTAKSGTGKSTHTKLWREVFGDRAVMVNDDKPLLRITEEGVFACGTPYNGKHHLGCNMTVPLKGLCILTRGEENSITEINKQQAYPMLLQQAYRPADPLRMTKVLGIIDKLTEKVKLYKLACNMQKEAAEVPYKGMKG